MITAMTVRRRGRDSSLQSRLAGRILDYARNQGLDQGAWLSENALAQAFEVSRTPVRGALRLLSRDGLVRAVPRRGYMLKRRVGTEDLGAYAARDSREDHLCERMAADRFSGELSELVLEADLIRRYRVPRGLLTRVLGRMAQDGILERRDGHGWRFLPTLDSEPLHDESYRYRLLIEPAALLEPGYELEPKEAHAIRDAHVRALQSRFRGMTSVAFYDLNAAFHEFATRCSGNRFLHQAVVQQNRLRRFFSYHWTYGHDRMRTSCEEHLAILDTLIAGDREQAATLMRLHLLGASRVRPKFG
jgi:DNA-binding GntR family transcriptional regulator